MENGADKKIDWEEVKPQFTASLERDEAELAVLEELSHESKAGHESKRIMLSLRILMKRLSKWQMKSSADNVPSLEDMSLSNVPNLEIDR